MGSSLVQSKPEGDWIDTGWGEQGKAAGYRMRSRCSGGGERRSYLLGSEEGRRGFREDSYKAIGTHKIRHFQLHRVGQS